MGGFNDCPPFTLCVGTFRNSRPKLWASCCWRRPPSCSQRNPATWLWPPLVGVLGDFCSGRAALSKEGFRAGPSSSSKIKAGITRPAEKENEPGNGGPAPNHVQSGGKGVWEFSLLTARGVPLSLVGTNWNGHDGSHTLGQGSFCCIGVMSSQGQRHGLRVLFWSDGEQAYFIYWSLAYSS